MTQTTLAARILLRNFSLEMTAKDTEALEGAAQSIPAGTAINLTFLGNETTEMRIEAAQAIVDAGFHPVPHISARRLSSADELRDYLERLDAVGAVTRLFIVGGDPNKPLGEFPDALSVIKTGMLEEFGVREVGVTGYPEGNPDIDDATLWAALERKLAALDEAGIDASITTQVSFDSTAVANWIRAVRARGITVPIRVGSPGPAGIKRLLGFARRLGIAANAALIKKYGASVTNLLGTSTPAKFLESAAEEFGAGLGASSLDGAEGGGAAGSGSGGSERSSGSGGSERASGSGRTERRVGDLGDVRIHFYTFGGLKATANWTKDYLGEGTDPGGASTGDGQVRTEGESHADAS